MENGCHLLCQDALTFIKSLPEHFLQCVICDPPFGIKEESFPKHYARETGKIIDGYTPAPQGDYQEWIYSWLKEIPRVLSQDGTFYLICGWNHLCDVEQALRRTKFKVLNHIIWKYSFGVYTKRKFVTSHYHIIRCGLIKYPRFYQCAYYDEGEKSPHGHSLQYADLEDVWIIPKEYQRGKVKNLNKLPNGLVEKLIRYATQPDDWVGDFFMGNFTTAYVSRELGRKVVGCDINENVCLEHIEKVLEIPCQNQVTEKPSAKPPNSGKKLSQEDKDKIIQRFRELHINRTKKECIEIMGKEFGRGYFSINNILKGM